MKLAKLAFIVFLSGSNAAFAHPGHGALEVHWHFEDLALAALGIVAVSGLVFLLRKVLKR